ncbi:hypothetical protein P879_05938 [Paragonimus westermani]|uniref:Uncharacterized protein n=1 Tax=Paragonimus westermani TaxID=34504 RepID=A0A8T0DEK0_9TREM|nr:hypothetical protein P879_05938 [Paragonimus westermani]
MLRAYGSQLLFPFVLLSTVCPPQLFVRTEVILKKELKAPSDALFDREENTNISAPPTMEPAIDSSRGEIPTKAIVRRLTDRMAMRSDFVRIMKDEVIHPANLCADLFLQQPVCLDLDLSKPLIVGDLFGQHGNLVTDYNQGRTNEIVDALEEPEGTDQSRTDNRHFIHFYAHNNLNFDSTILSLDHLEEG